MHEMRGFEAITWNFRVNLFKAIFMSEAKGSSRKRLRGIIVGRQLLATSADFAPFWETDGE